MTLKSGVWHYTCTPIVVSDDGLCGRSGCGVDTEDIVDGPLGRFGAGGLSHMQGTPVGTTEGRGDALLSFQGPANRVSVRTLAGFTQAPSDHLYELVGDDGDEQMPPSDAFRAFSVGVGRRCGCDGELEPRRERYDGCRLPARLSAEHPGALILKLRSRPSSPR